MRGHAENTAEYETPISAIHFKQILDLPPPH